MDANDNLKRLVAGAGMPLTDIAAIGGANYSTVRAWLQERAPLNPSKRDHRRFVSLLCAHLGVSEAEVWGRDLPPLIERDQVAVGEARPGLHLLEILLDTLESPTATRPQKDAARHTIREWVRQVV